MQSLNEHKINIDNCSSDTTSTVVATNSLLSTDIISQLQKSFNVIGKIYL